MTPEDERRRRRLAERLAQGQPDEAAPGSSPPLARQSLDKRSLRGFYDSVSQALDATPLGEFSRFLNYGYADSPEDRAVVDVPAGTLDRASVKLVLELVGDHDLRDRLVLDVGSGRGGTIATLLEHFAPRLAVGVELSWYAVRFCRRSSGDARAHFVVGDAQRLPVATGSFDVVTSVESAHCYPDTHAFHAEVHRVLRHGGTFLYTDILPSNSLGWRQADLISLGFGLEVERDITRQVLVACDRIALQRLSSFDAASDAHLRDFLAVDGSPTYEAMRTGSSTYVIWRMRRS